MFRNSEDRNSRCCDITDETTGTAFPAALGIHSFWGYRNLKMGQHGKLHKVENLKVWRLMVEQEQMG